MAIGLAMCMVTVCFQDGMFEDLFSVMVEQQLGHVQVHHPDYPSSRVLFDVLEDAEALMADVEAVPGTLAVAPRVYGFALVGGEERTAGGLLQGISPSRERLVTPLSERVVEGRYLTDEPSGEALLGERLAETLDIEVGQSILTVTQSADGSMGNELFTVVGLVRTGNVQLDRSGAVLHIADLQRLLVLEGRVHGLTLLADSEADLARYEDAVREQIGQEEVEVLAWWEASPQTAEIMAMRDAGAAILLGIVFAVAAFGILNTMMMSVFERTVELGVIKALGMRPRDMIWLILLESVMLAAVASVIGLVLGGLGDAWLMHRGFDLSGAAEDGFSFAGVMIEPVVYGSVRPAPIAFMVLALFAVTLLSSLWPAIRASRLQPVESIRSE